MNNRSQNYVFLSYSHSDDINKFVQFFDKEKYNVVFDTDLSYGELWNLKVRRYISSPKCKGVITFISRASLCSEPVMQETDYVKQFDKNHFAISLENSSLSSILETIKKQGDRDVAEIIIGNFPKEKLYVNEKDFVSDFSRIESTFATWGFERFSEERESVHFAKYSSGLVGEKDRLVNQSLGYYTIDKKVVKKVLDTFDRETLAVLDLGCSNGALAYSRFNDEKKIKKVIGLDYCEADIEEAKKANYGEKFAFYTLDLEGDDFILKLKSILNENGINKIDIVFSALTFHHLQEPIKLLLRLYDIFNEDGKIILRGSDDGGKLCYPESELMSDFLDRYATLIKGVSDRNNGRKLYNQLYVAGYENIEMDYGVTDTCEKSRKEKEALFSIGFSFRKNRLLEAKQSDQLTNERLVEIDWQLTALDRLSELFCRRDFWYSVVSYVAIAGLK